MIGIGALSAFACNPDLIADRSDYGDTALVLLF
jgi:hypothetical protein